MAEATRNGNESFNGRVDLLVVDLKEISEIKPNNYPSYWLGKLQLNRYLGSAPTHRASNGDWLFGGRVSFSLQGRYGTYTYINMRDGIILYNYSLKPEYQRSFGLTGVPAESSSRIPVVIRFVLRR